VTVTVYSLLGEDHFVSLETIRCLRFQGNSNFDREWFGRIKYLVVNETEAEILANVPIHEIEDARVASEELLRLGAEVVLITLGSSGSYYATGTTYEYVPAFHVDPVDATAAGDCYCGALAVALVEGKSLYDSVRFASAAAALSVSRLGAQPSLPYRSEIDQFMEDIT